MRLLGLRARATVLFAAGALGVSASLALATYELSRRSVLAERERTAVRATYVDAALVRQGLAADVEVVDVLRTLDTGASRRPLLRRDGQWYARTADTGLTEAVPIELRALVEHGGPAAQRVRAGGQPLLVVGVPLPTVGTDYYELISLAEADATLRGFARTLLLVALATTAGGAALGWWASRGVLRPLTDVAATARRIARGDLAARLPEEGDSDLAPLTRSFNAMVTELQSRLERDRRFAADVSHELRSPLQTLVAASSVLERRRSEMQPRTAAAASLIVAEVSRFEQLVADLLELARSDQPAQLADTEVREVVERAVRGRAKTDVVDVPEGLVWPLDGRRMERVLANLVDNANRHGGGVTALRAWVENDCLLLVVEDDGPGIALEDRVAVFDRFGRGQRSHARGASGADDGTGLGLAIVMEHVQAHGGTIEIGDVPQGGARFEVRLPKQQQGSAA